MKEKLKKCARILGVAALVGAGIVTISYFSGSMQQGETPRFKQYKKELAQSRLERSVDCFMLTETENYNVLTGNLGENLIGFVDFDRNGLFDNEDYGLFESDSEQYSFFPSYEFTMFGSPIPAQDVYAAALKNARLLESRMLK
ncbi:MAG: hypothetical protein V1725_00590 [archaeon]